MAVKCGEVSADKVVRWYVLWLPVTHRGRVESGLESELERRARDGEPAFRFFAPSYVEMRHNPAGQLVQSQQQLLLNYVFVHASERELIRLKQFQPQYNFMRRQRDRQGDLCFPYVSDAQMRFLRWVARSYQGRVPVWPVEGEWLSRGDRVVIVNGGLKGVEATVVKPPQGGSKVVVVSVDQWMCVPLIKLHEGDYEPLSLSKDGGSRGDRTLTEAHDRLHRALCRHLENNTGADDLETAATALSRCEKQRTAGEGEFSRSVALCHCLMAHTVLNHRNEADRLAGMLQALLPAMTDSVLRGLLLVTLYGCTDSSIHHQAAHKLAAGWKDADSGLTADIRSRLDDYDRCLNH